MLATDVQITDTNKTRFYILSGEPLTDDGLARAVFVVTCEASRMDDVMVAMHENGLELVCLHDRPEGSALGSYHYVIEVEDPEGLSGDRLETIAGLEGVRYAGSFRSVEK